MMTALWLTYYARNIKSAGLLLIYALLGIAKYRAVIYE